MILLTGVTGHLGANLVRRLLDDGHSVRVLLRSDGDIEAIRGLDVERVFGDLRDPEACRKAIQGCHHVHHCAALVSTLQGDKRHKKDIFESNVLGTRNLLQAARQHEVQRVVVTGSLSAVGHDPNKPVNEDVPFNPFTPMHAYAMSKAFVEMECWKACNEGLDVVVAVSCAILGPHDYKPSRMGRTLIDFAHRKLKAYVPGGFEFVSAADMVEGHMLAMEKGRPGQKYIFCTKFLTVDDVMGLFEKVTGQPRPKLRLPGWLMAGIASVSDAVFTRFFPRMPRRFTAPAVRLLRMQRRADCTKAKTELGFQPSNIEDAVQSAYDDFVRRGLIEAPENSVQRLLNEPQSIRRVGIAHQGSPGGQCPPYEIDH